MNLGKYNLGGLALAASGGALAVAYGVMSSGHVDPKSLAGGLLVGAGAGTLSFLVPPHKTDGTTNPVYGYASLVAQQIPGTAGTVAQQVIETAAQLPVAPAVTPVAPASASAPQVIAPPVSSAAGSDTTPASTPATTTWQQTALQSILAQAAAAGVTDLLAEATKK